MASFFPSLSKTHQDFIGNQNLFFVATSGTDTRVNVSPKGLDSLRILDESTVIWMNLTGSGNETAAHVLENGRMTLMLCSFEKKPLILRIYGKAAVVNQSHAQWEEYRAHFVETPGDRQVFVLNIDSVQTSCGYGVPLMDFVSERDTLDRAHAAKGRAKVEEYWYQNNQKSIDGLDTDMIKK